MPAGGHAAGGNITPVRGPLMMIGPILVLGLVAAVITLSAH
jgi:hypothetical protein